MENITQAYTRFLRDEIQEYSDDRRGLLCRIPGLIKRAALRMKIIRNCTFGIQGPKLFNYLPKELRDRGDTDDPKLLEKFNLKSSSANLRIK